MKKLIFAVVLMLAGPVLADDLARKITVIGQGRVDSMPDMASITLGVVSEGKTGSDALGRNFDAVAKVLQELESAGIAKTDVQTSNLSLSPRWDRRGSNQSKPPRIVGFVASNNLSVRVRDLDNLGVVLDAVVQNGANTFHGLSFGLQAPQPVMDQARAKAISDARRKAQLYADAAGVTLGDVLRISEADQSAGRPAMMDMEMASRSAAVPIAQGEVNISASITVVFGIAD